MKKLSVLTVLSILLLVVSAVGAVTLPFFENFESYTVGQEPPAPWFTLAVGKGTVTNLAAVSGTQSLMVSGGPFSSQTAVVDLGANYPNLLSYKGWVKINSAGGSAFVGFFDQFQNMAPQFNAVQFSTDGNVYFHNADENYPVSTLLVNNFALGVWHKIYTEIDFTDLKANVWIDDFLVGNQIQVGPKDATYELNGNTYNFELRKIGIEHYSGDPIFFDDFLVQSVPEPITLLLLGSGLIGLAGYGRKRFFKK